MHYYDHSQSVSASKPTSPFLFLRKSNDKLSMNKCNRKKGTQQPQKVTNGQAEIALSQRSALCSQLLHGLDSVTQGSHCWLCCPDCCCRALTRRAECVVRQDRNHQDPEACGQSWLSQHALHLESTVILKERTFFSLGSPGLEQVKRT